MGLQKFRPSGMSVRLLWLFLFPLLSQGDKAKILVIPGNINSHGLYFAKFAEGLAELGHKVHVVAPGNGKLTSKIANDNLTITLYDVEGETPYANSEEASEVLTRGAFTDSHLEKFQISYTFGTRLMAELENDCIHLLENQAVMEEIRGGGFEFAVMDPMSINCYYLVPYSLGIPYASLSVPFVAWYFRHPRLPSFASSFADTDEMTFTQRFLCFVTEYAEMALVNTTTVLAEKYVRNKPPLDLIQLYERSSLFLYLEDLSVCYPRPQMPNSVAVGDIMAQPAKPLPEDLQKFLDASSEGAIIVSFGSFFDHIPEFVAKKFCDAFRRVRYHIVWKLKYVEFCTGLNNLKVLPWIPQNDLLAHENVRLFITHGGLNGLIESVYHSKPVIVFPIAIDQPSNAVAAHHKGFGIHMNIANFTTEDLEANINKMFTDSRYTAKAKFASNLLRHKQESPAERAAILIEHVVKFGDAHLRTGAMKLSPLQFLMFDVFLFIVCLFLVIFVLFVLCIFCAYKGLRRIFCRRVKHKTA